MDRGGSLWFCGQEKLRILFRFPSVSYFLRHPAMQGARLDPSPEGSDAALLLLRERTSFPGI